MYLPTGVRDQHVKTLITYCAARTGTSFALVLPIDYRERVGSCVVLLFFYVFLLYPITYYSAFI